MFLVTNDDGDGVLLRTLLSAARKVEQGSICIIPDSQKSAVAKAMTFHKPIRLKKVEEGFFTLSGTPADCVAIGLHGDKLVGKELGNGKPRIVLAGINNGFNMSMQSFLTSGTIGACIEAVIHGKKGIAFSLAVEQGNPDPQSKEMISGFIEALLQKIKENGFPEGIDILSINFPPGLGSYEFRLTELKHKHFEVEILNGKDPDGKGYYWLGGIGHECNEECKGHECHGLLSEKKITITPIRLTMDFQKDRFRKWFDGQ